MMAIPDVEILAVCLISHSTLCHRYTDGQTGRRQRQSTRSWKPFSNWTSNKSDKICRTISI